MTGGIATAIAFGVVLPVAAGPGKPARQGKVAKNQKDQTVYCPIMDLKLKKSEAKSRVVKGKTYYFCCAVCKKQFDKNPTREAARYNAKIAALKKGTKKAETKKAGTAKTKKA